MSRRWMTYCALLFTLFAAKEVSAQGQQAVPDPTHWSYDAIKLATGEYEVCFRLKLDSGWHVWSLKPGGDGYEIVPSFSYDKAIVASGELTETGHATTTLMEGMDNKVTYLSGDVSYKQKVKVKGERISGEHEYQVCNDMLCLPPTKKKFEIDLSEKK